MLPEPEPRLAAASWLRAPETRRVLAALQAEGRPARFVGGCVRDALIGRPIGDFANEFEHWRSPWRSIGPGSDPSLLLSPQDTFIGRGQSPLLGSSGKLTGRKPLRDLN